MSDDHPPDARAAVTVPGLTPPPLNPLLRKAAVDAGFDLEPEVEGAWWRLRASGVPGVAWLHPLMPGPGALIALPLASQLAELGLPQFPTTDPADGSMPALPPGAAGAVACPTPHATFDALRRVWSLRASTPVRLRAKLDAGVAAALAPLGPSATAPAATEVVAEVRRRIGQDLFREALLDYWDGRCAVTGLGVSELLRASHAKPWSVASDAERLDVHNGLLLAVHLDALFDRGLLTFDEQGRGELSPQVGPDVRETLGLSESRLMLRRVHPAHRPYLAYHRVHVFRP